MERCLEGGQGEDWYEKLDLPKKVTVFWSEKNVRKIQLKIVNRVQLNREKLWRKRK